MVAIGSRISIITQILLILFVINITKSAPSPGLLDQLLQGSNNNPLVVVLDENDRGGHKHSDNRAHHHHSRNSVNSRQNHHQHSSNRHRQNNNGVSKFRSEADSSNQVRLDNGLINLLSQLGNRVIVKDSNDNVNYVIFSRASDDNRDQRSPLGSVLRQSNCEPDHGCTKPRPTKADYEDKCEVSSSCGDENKNPSTRGVVVPYRIF